MRTLTLLILLTLTACAAQPSQPIQAHAAGGILAVGTLAPFGSWEFELAPGYTRSASIRARTESRLSRGAIHSNTARNVQALCDQARALLDAATTQTADGKPTPAAREKLKAAQSLLDRAAHLVEGTP